MNTYRPSWLVALLLLLASPFVSAHQSSVVYSDVRVEGREVVVTLQVANSDLYEALGLGQDRPLSIEEARTGQAQLTRYLLPKITVTNHGHSCAGEPDDAEFLDRGGGFFFVQRLRFRCLRSLEDAELTYNLFFDLDPRHQGLCHLRAFGGESEHVFRSQSRSLRLGRPLGIVDNVRDYLALGIEHIFTGYDHLAFLFGLLIIAAAVGTRRTAGSTAESADRSMRRGLGYVIRIVTAFTIAHSVTLIASALGWLALPSRFVESFIAVSIGYVALENILNPEPRHRFLLTFCFGLVHGFGFASVLQEVGLPKSGLLLSLLSFNVGVELGQLAVVALGFPVLYLLAKHAPPTEPVPAAAGGRTPSRRRGTPFRPVELGLLAVLLGLCVVLFLRFSLPLPTVLLVVLGLPGLLLFLVPRYGYERCVRIGTSGLLLALSLFWLLERALGRVLLSGLLG